MRYIYMRKKQKRYKSGDRKVESRTKEFGCRMMKNLKVENL